MLELQIKHGSDEPGSVRPWERACSTRGCKGRLLVVVLAPGNHRRGAGDEHLQRKYDVNVGSSIESGRELNERSGRTSRIPGS
jgi:hypothetical protein